MAFVSNARISLGSLVVNIGSHQWGFTDGVRYYEQFDGVGPYGLIFRTKHGISSRFREVRFVKIDTKIEELRQLYILAGRSGTRVKFTPDVSDLATFWWVDLPTTAAFIREVENRESLTVRLIEQSPGV